MGSDEDYGFSPMGRMRDERDAALAELSRTRARVCEAARAIIEAIGSNGPENVEESARRVAPVISQLRSERDAAIAERDRLRRELEALRSDITRDALACAESDGPVMGDFVRSGIERAEAHGARIALERVADRVADILRGDCPASAPHR